MGLSAKSDIVFGFAREPGPKGTKATHTAHDEQETASERLGGGGGRGEGRERRRRERISSSVTPRTNRPPGDFGDKYPHIHIDVFPTAQQVATAALLPVISYKLV